jgi:hypothetical protein
MKTIAHRISTALCALFAVSVVIASATATASTNNLFFNINANDSASYSTSNPTTWTDLSSANRNGTVIGTLTYDAVNGALKFPGSASSYVDMGEGFNNFGSGITIEFEAHFGPVNQNWERIFDFGNGAGNNNIWIGVFGESFASNALAIELWDGATDKGRCISDAGILTANTFAKYVITMDGAKCRMYKDGIAINTRVGRWSQASFSAPTTDGSPYTFLPNNVSRSKNYIGKSNWISDPAFDGAIKYVRIYTEAISSSDVENNAATYTLTYAATGADSGSAPAARTGNGLMGLDSNSGSLTKARHTFAGWATSPDQKTALTGTFNLASDTTLHPVWTPFPAQVITWAPTNTSLLTADSPAIPSALASTNGGGVMTYSITSSGATGCSVNSTTAEVTFTGVGTCTVRASAAQSDTHEAGYTDVNFEIGSSAPSISLHLNMSAGDAVENSAVDYGASGLQANSAWSLVLRSTPQTLATGTFTGTVLSGNTQLPTGLPTGWHSVTFTGISVTGSTISHAVWFEVSNSGTLLQTSGVEPPPTVSPDLNPEPDATSVNPPPSVSTTSETAQATQPSSSTSEITPTVTQPKPVATSVSSGKVAAPSGLSMPLTGGNSSTTAVLSVLLLMMGCVLLGLRRLSSTHPSH